MIGGLKISPPGKMIDLWATPFFIPNRPGERNRFLTLPAEHPPARKFLRWIQCLPLFGNS
jgi:hypothetical protein